MCPRERKVGIEDESYISDLASGCVGAVPRGRGADFCGCF